MDNKRLRELAGIITENVSTNSIDEVIQQLVQLSWDEYKSPKEVMQLFIQAYSTKYPNHKDSQLS